MLNTINNKCSRCAYEGLYYCCYHLVCESNSAYTLSSQKIVRYELEDSLSLNGRYRKYSNFISKTNKL